MGPATIAGGNRLKWADGGVSAMTQQTTEPGAERLLTAYSGRLSTLLAVGGFLAFLGRGAIPPLVPAIVADLSITIPEAGVGLSVLWVAYAAAHYPGGRLSDGLTRKTLLLASFGLMIGGFALLSAVPTYLSFLVAVALVGVGQGLFMPASRGLVADLFVRRRGQALGLQVGASSAGSALSAGVAVAALSVVTWQGAFLPTVVGLSAVAALMHRWNREPYALARVDLELSATLARLFTARRMRLITGSYCLFALAWMGVISFLPTFLHAAKGFSIATSSAAYALFYVAGTVASPLAGRVADRFSRMPAALGTVLVAAAGLTVCVATQRLPVVAAGVALFGVGLFGFPPVMQSVVFEVAPDDNLAGDFGALKSVYTGVGALAPVYVGFVAERAGYTPAFGTFVLCLLACAVGIVAAARTPE
ncbi:MFS transporter [Halobacteriales archaeon QS_1_68_17]|nr:MAG: MFS transporter [Halobacteriales archaeon QS_1_68_17]